MNGPADENRRCDPSLVGYYLDCVRKAKAKGLMITTTATDFIVRDEFNVVAFVVNRVNDLRTGIRDYREPKGYKEARLSKGSGVRTGESIKRRSARGHLVHELEVDEPDDRYDPRQLKGDDR